MFLRIYGDNQRKLFRNSFKKILLSTHVHNGKKHSLQINKKDILIYRGSGVSPGSYRMLYYTLGQSINRSYYRIHPIHSRELNQKDWMNKTALLVFPGGADIPFMLELSSNYGKFPNSNKNIIQYVNSGGSYLGICAGSYYACNEVLFDENGPLQVKGERELRFFPGKAIGPAFSGFSYGNEDGARAVRVEFMNQMFNGHQHKEEASCYYYGGGYFQPYDIEDTRYQPLAYYSRQPNSTYGEEAIAAVLCFVGRGNAVLCGVHPEFDPDLMKHKISIPLFSEMSFPNLNHGRKLLMLKLLEECNIEINHEERHKKILIREDVESDSWEYHL